MDLKKRSLFIFKKEYENFIFELAKGEGATMTFAQTVATLHNEIVTAKPKEITLVRNLQKGFDFVLSSLAQDRISFSKYIICTINSLIASDDNFDCLGDFRKGTIRIAGTKHQGVNPLIARDVFEDMVQSFYSQKISNELIIKLALSLCRQQFFGDGNKRTAQLLMNGLLVKEGFVPFVLNFKEEKIIDALITYYDNDNVEDLYQICIEKQEIINQSYQVPQSD